MFGCIVAGRLVQTNLQQVGENKYLFLLDNAQSINHIVVFLLGTIPLPTGTGAGVYFSWPPYNSWKFLGYLSNEKPSAVFRLSSASPSDEVEMSSDNSNTVIQLGISVEPMQNIEQQVAALKESKASSILSTTGNTNEVLKIAQKLLHNLFNYAMSFSKPIATPFGFTASVPEAIPTEAFKKWYTVMETKAQKDIGFWKDS